MQPAEYWVRHLRLQPHPEGGFFGETYRSALEITPEGYPGRRPASTAIYFLITAAAFSAFHRLRSDEGWHFYTGSPLRLHLIHPDGSLETRLLGADPAQGQQFQTVVPAGVWFAAEVPAPDGYCLAGCTVAPGFDFADFELAERAALSAAYPQHAELIRMLTR